MDQLAHRLLRAGDVNVPDNPDPEGTVLQLQRPDREVKVGIWLMPDNQLPGMLEDFIEFLVPAGDGLWPRAVDCVDDIPTEERRFRPAHRQKANVHTWLAWQEDPGTPLGQAITKRYLDAEAAYAHQLVEAPATAVATVLAPQTCRVLADILQHVICSRRSRFEWVDAPHRNPTGLKRVLLAPHRLVLGSNPSGLAVDSA